MMNIIIIPILILIIQIPIVLDNVIAIMIIQVIPMPQKIVAYVILIPITTLTV